MTTASVDTDRLAASRRLYQLADEAGDERSRWREPGIRCDLATIAAQLNAAARVALTASVDYGDAWAEAAVTVLRRYIGCRKLLEHMGVKP